MCVCVYFFLTYDAQASVSEEIPITTIHHLKIHMGYFRCWFRSIPK